LPTPLPSSVDYAPNPGVIQWASTVSKISVSVVTLEEVLFGLAFRPNVRIRAWFDSFLEMYCHVLPVTREIAKASGQLRGSLRAGGEARTQADMLIAATAQHHQLVLVTRNVRDFEGCGIPVLNPFS
jgi:predicted nucleic acid-binding protein